MQHKPTLIAPLALLAVAGCAHPQQPTPPPPPAPVAREAPPAPPVAQAAAPLTRRRDGAGDCSSTQLCVDGACTDISAGLAACSQLVLHFNFDSAEILDADKPVLERAARCLRADPNAYATIEGNADERGTEEYNLALAEQRA